MKIIFSTSPGHIFQKFNIFLATFLKYQQMNNTITISMNKTNTVHNVNSQFN